MEFRITIYFDHGKFTEVREMKFGSVEQAEVWAETMSKDPRVPYIVIDVEPKLLGKL